MIESSDPAGLVFRIAGFGLPGHEDGEEPLSVSAESCTSLLGFISRHRISGLAVAALQADWLQLPPEYERDLLARHREAMVGALAIERRLLTVADAFDDAGVQFLVLKGPAIAHSIYPDPSWREFGDLDLLVSTADWKRACSALEALGLRRALPEPRPGFDERFGKATVFGGNGEIEIDLHRTLVLGPFSQWIDPAVLLGRTADFSLGGRTLRRLDDTMLLLHACMHASLGWWPPLTVPLRDVLQAAHFSTVNWKALERQSAEWKLRAVMQHAFQFASSTLHAEIPAEAAAVIKSTAPSEEEDWALRAYTTDRRWDGWEARATLKAIRGIRRKARFALSLAFPSRTFVAARMGERGPISYLRRVSAALGGWMRREAR